MAGPARRRGGEIIDIDAEVLLQDLHRGAVLDLDRLAPFGEGNPRPTFASRRCRVAGSIRPSASPRGAISFFLRQDGAAVQASSRDAEGLRRRMADGAFAVAYRTHIGRGGEVELDVIAFPDAAAGPGTERGLS